MVSRWLVKCEVNMDASNEVGVIVKANTERKAKIMAANECYKKGYFHVNILTCKEMSEEPNEISR